MVELTQSLNSTTAWLRRCKYESQTKNCLCINFIALADLKIKTKNKESAEKFFLHCRFTISKNNEKVKCRHVHTTLLPIAKVLRITVWQKLREGYLRRVITSTTLTLVGLTTSIQFSDVQEQMMVQYIEMAAFKIHSSIRPLLFPLGHLNFNNVWPSWPISSSSRQRKIASIRYCLNDFSFRKT